MKNVRMVFSLIALVSVMAASQGFAITQIRDGGVHNISNLVNDTIWVDFESPGLRTTVNVLNGAEISGGDDLAGYNECTLNVSGGYIYHAVHHGLNGLLNISGGTINQVNHHSAVTMSGGTVNTLYASNVYSASSMIMTGGHIGTLNDGIGSITISGGSVNNLDLDGGGASQAGVVNIIGSDFAINGNPVDFGRYFRTDFSSGTLTGRLANGDYLDTHFHIDGSASFTLIPEPATFCLFALAGLFIRNKK
ncbi:MAG: hypothetical protein BWY69_01250 [Planctomycetes bacterium ADurb.Bin401]|nr:MAG: hypothetical protein BWY69_01250 [Planctomycetes bacterium ADurb.Bin401]